jgi:mono/diheme cytochrome c family protein
MAEKSNNESKEQELVGLLAQFDDPETLVHACNEAREAGYTKMDAYSPFPVHGIDPAIGIKRTILPFIVLGVALGAVCLGMGLQLYANSQDYIWPFPGYKFLISGKPIFSIPANIPVTFEIIVLSSAFATFFGMWILNQLPRLSNPLHRVSRFKRVTNDKFFLLLEKADEKFSRSGSESQLNQWGAVSIDEVNQDLTDTALPKWLATVGILGAILLMLPPVAIFSQWGQTNRQPRLHVVPDMDWQHKSKTQTMAVNLSNEFRGVSLMYDDFRSARRPVDGAIAFGSLDIDSELNYGVKSDFAYTITSGGSALTRTAEDEDGQDDAAAAAPADEDNLEKYVTTLPENFELTAEVLDRGQQRFEIYCAACHGYAGAGNGLVNQRAMALAATGSATWTSARSLHEADVKDDAKNPVGRIYDTITNGRGNMGPYKAQIPVQDRWAIVAYVKALQETGITSDTPVAEDADADAATEGETEKSEEASEQVSEKEADKQEKPAATEDVTEQEKKDKDDH